MILHADEASWEGNAGRKVAVESFVVGGDIERGERLQWVVEGGKYKASYLLPDTGTDGEDYANGEGTEGLLISEVSFLTVRKVNCTVCNVCVCDADL